MKFTALARRFLLPSILVTLIGFLRFKAFISPRAEVDLSPSLRIGRKSQISSFTKLKSTAGPLEIGERCSIATGCFITAGPGGTYIGNDCLIGANCTIVSNAYGYADLHVLFADQPQTSKGTRIGKNVLIGSNCVIVDGATIGDNVMIDACSRVSGNIPDNSVAQGNPARVIFTRR